MTEQKTGKSRYIICSFREHLQLEESRKNSSRPILAEIAITERWTSTGKRLEQLKNRIDQIKAKIQGDLESNVSYF